MLNNSVPMVLLFIIVHILMMVHEWSIVLSDKLTGILLYLYIYIIIISHYKQLIGRIPCKISHYDTQMMLMCAFSLAILTVLAKI